MGNTSPLESLEKYITWMNLNEESDITVVQVVLNELGGAMPRHGSTTYLPDLYPLFKIFPIGLSHSLLEPNLLES